MIKVLLCSQSPSNTGGVRVWAGTVMSCFSSNNKSNNVSVSLFSMTRSSSLAHMLSWYKRMISIIKDYWHLPYKLWKVLKNEEYDILHIVSVGNLGLLRDLLFLIIAKKRRIKGIVHFHFGRIPQIKKDGGLEWHLLKKVLYWADGIIVLDQKSYDVVNDMYPFKVWKIANSFSDELLGLDLNAFRRSEKKIVFVGHVVPEKGIMELLEATYDLEGIELYIYGPTNDNMMETINIFLTNHPFKGKIFIKGLQPLSVIYKELATSELFVLPTYTEGFPLIIMEAMVCGCPIITTPVGAIEEMLYSNNTPLGYIVPVRNTNKLKEQIVYCLSHKEEAFSRALGARKKALETYSTNAMANNLQEVWQAIKE